MKIDIKKLDQSSKLNILVIGDVMLDEYIVGKVTRISPEAPVPVVWIQKTFERLGGSGNVALNLKSLGVNTYLSCAIGKDHHGKKLYDLIKQHNITPCGIYEDENRPTTVKTRVIGNHNQQLLRIDREDLSYIPFKKLTGLIDEYKKMHAHQPFDAIIFQDYNKGFLPEKFIGSVIDWAKNEKIFVSVDPKKENFFAYQHADLFKPNLKELLEAFNINTGEENRYIEQLDNIVFKLKNKIASKYNVITLSEKGIYMEHDGHSFISPATQRDVADVSGAGDTVIATITTALLCGYPPDECAKIANIAAGLVCIKPGVVPITKQELIAGLKNLDE